ncbi:hypothetical protein HRW20_36280, partial [Streptomyces lunaelactis]|nr:hypothetical protein [Streptomyces lunaelactis]
HIPLQHRATSWWSNYLGPWTAHAVIELRYSHAESGESHRAGREDWWPRGTPDADPVGALTALLGR